MRHRAAADVVVAAEVTKTDEPIFFNPDIPYCETLLFSCGNECL